MLAATFFSLLAPGIEAALPGGAARGGAAALVAGGVLAGAGALALVHRWVPQNVPEGLAVGGLRPLALAFAAGAMLFVIASEIIPETAREGTKIATTFPLLAGFLAMMTLDISLG